MKKPYEEHEMIYRWMKRKGISVWGQKGSGTQGKSCRGDTLLFLKDIFRQPWMPKHGRAIELGCGTGPILRWICKKGFGGLGIDISPTAVSMAKEQSKGYPVKFRRGDVCRLDSYRLGKFDLAIDGLCLHCITEARDRKKYLNNVFNILNEGGLFILFTMCDPVDRKLFYHMCKGHKLIGKKIYVPFHGTRYDHVLTLGEKTCLPSRYIGHWKDILAEVTRAGFELKLIRYNTCHSKDPFGTLTLGAIKP